MQRNFIAWYLNGSRGGAMKDAALAAFVSPNDSAAAVQSHIPERLLQSHYAEQNPSVFGKREVILSLYLSGE